MIDRRTQRRTPKRPGPLSMRIEDGVAEYLGDGVWALLQRSDEGPQSTVVHEDTMRLLLAAAA